MKEHKGQMTKSETVRWAVRQQKGKFDYFDVLAYMKKEFPHRTPCSVEIAHIISNLVSSGDLEKVGVHRYISLSGSWAVINQYRKRRSQ
jgi:hypothetical protein